MKKLRAVSLFSGIGGFDIALHESGVVETVAGCDCEPFVAEIFTKRFGVPVIPDVCEVTLEHPLLADGIEVVAGGFPCQPVSLAGKGKAQDDDRWLWPEFRRVIQEFRPRWVFIENVPGLRKRGLVDVLRDLAEDGYDAEWDGIPAAAVGAPHLRDRVWIVAYPKGQQLELWGPALGMFGGDVDVAQHMRAGRMRDGEVWEVEPIAELTDVRSGALLPTPVANDVKGDVIGHLRNKNGWDKASRTQITSLAVLARNGFEQPSEEQLAEAMRTAAETDRAAENGWERVPTPTARDGSSRAEQERRFYVHGEDNPTLLGFARTLEGTAEHPTRQAEHWPTPQASDGTGGRNEMGAIHREIETGELRRPSGSKVTIPLGSAVRAVEDGLWPTPKASPSGPDYARADREESGGDDLATAAARTQKGQLNPRWVEWLMGFPLEWTNPEVDNDDLEYWTWDVEPLPRVAEGVKLRRQRLTALGNALVWKCAFVVVQKALG